MNPDEDSPGIGPAGTAPVEDWSWAAISSWRSPMSPSSRSMFWRVSLSADCFWPRTVSSSASRASSCSRVRSSSAFLAASSSRASRMRIDRVLGLVPQAVDAVGDRRVLLLDVGEVLVAVEEVVEAVGFEDHGERVGLVRLVHRDQAIGELIERALEAGAQDAKVLGLDRELALDAVEVLLDDRLAVAEHRDLAGELVDLLGVLRDRLREHALLLLLLLKLGLASSRARPAGPAPGRRRSARARSRLPAAVAKAPAVRRRCSRCGSALIGRTSIRPCLPNACVRCTGHHRHPQKQPDVRRKMPAQGSNVPRMRANA